MKSFHSVRFCSPEELAEFVNGKLDIEVQQICFAPSAGWVLYYWTW